IRKAGLMLNDAEIPNHLDYVFMRGRIVALTFMPLSFGLILILGTLGLAVSIASGRHTALTWLLILIAAGIMVSVLPFFVADRYRAPLVVPLIIAAGGAVSAIATSFRDQGLRSRLL